jgi:competence protein ComEC
MLWPTLNSLENLQPNDASLVVLLEHETDAGTRRILFTGDIQEQGIAGLFESGSTLAADVLIAPHHGSREDNTAALIEAVNPTWIVSSNGRTLSQKQVSFTEAAGDREFLRTSNVGAVTIHIWPDGTIEVSGFLDDSVRPLGVTE